MVLNRWLTGAVSGGLVTYFLDPDNGEERRNRLAALWKNNQDNARHAAHMAAEAVGRAGPLAEQLREGRWDALRWDALFPPKRQEVPMAVKLLVATAVGGMLVYFLDPDSGERRRRRVLSFLKDKQDLALETGKQVTADATTRVKQGVEGASGRFQAVQARLAR